jgi:zinc and cadmium transporter
MDTLLWIIAATIAMSLFAWIGLITLALQERILNKIIPYLVALAAGSLTGGSFFHLIPEALEAGGSHLSLFVWVTFGFAVLFLMEILLNWHHCHEFCAYPDIRKPKKPITYLILLADGLHNFIGGLAIASSFMVSTPAGLITWIIAAAHEIPQELGDFGILIYSGWEKRKALFFNFLSALTIVPAGVITFFSARLFDTTFLLSFAAGNFIYIAASDLIPEMKHQESLGKGLSHFFSFLLGAALILFLKILLEE